MSESQHSFRALAEQLHPYVIAERWVVAPLFENIQYFAVSLGIILGGMFLGWIVYKLIIYFGLPKEAQRKFRVLHGKNGKKKVEYHDSSGGVKWGDDIEAQMLIGKHSKRTANDHIKSPFYSSRSSVVHFVAIVVKYTIWVFGFYFGFGVAGLNFFNMAFGLGVIGICVTYGGMSILSNVAGTLVMTSTGNYTENMIVTVNGTKGRILEITTFFTFLETLDGKHNVACVPNRYFNDAITLRSPNEEAEMLDEEVEGISMRYTPAASGGGGVAHTILKQRSN
jgi:small-conductance mechanosensitive channel